MDDPDVPQAAISDVPSTFGDGVVLLDVREDDEWQRGHAPQARHIPMGDVPARLAPEARDLWQRIRALDRAAPAAGVPA